MRDPRETDPVEFTIARAIQEAADVIDSYRLDGLNRDAVLDGLAGELSGRDNQRRAHK
jgi:hypothetical protein